MHFQINQVSLHDMQELYECISQVYAETDFMLMSAGETENLLQGLERRFNHITLSNKDSLWVVKQHEKVVGWLDAQAYQARKKQHAIYIVVGLLKEYWSQGLGSKLLETLIEWSISNTIKRIELTVVETNVRAVNLYKKYGFVVEGIKQKSIMIDGNYYNELMMARLL